VAAAGNRSLAKVAPVTAKRAMPRLARPRHHCGFGGLSATNRRRHRRLGAHSGRGGGRGDEGSLACLEAAGRGRWAALAIELDPWLEFCFSHPVFGF